MIAFKLIRLVISTPATIGSPDNCQDKKGLKQKKLFSIGFDRQKTGESPFVCVCGQVPRCKSTKGTKIKSEALPSIWHTKMEKIFSKNN